MVLHQVIAQFIKLANQPVSKSEANVANNIEKLVNTLNKEKEVVHIDIQRILKDNC